MWRIRSAIRWFRAVDRSGVFAFLSVFRFYGSRVLLYLIITIIYLVFYLFSTSYAQYTVSIMMMIIIMIIIIIIIIVYCMYEFDNE